MTMCCNDINVPQYANLVHVLFLYCCGDHALSLDVIPLHSSAKEYHTRKRKKKERKEAKKFSATY